MSGGGRTRAAALPRTERSPALWNAKHGFGKTLSEKEWKNENDNTKWERRKRRRRRRRRRRRGGGEEEEEGEA